MKKITFALACASTLALFAEPITSTGFEGYTTLPFTGLSLKDDTGNDGGASNSRWLYLGASGSEDGSTVKAYGGDNLETPAVATTPTENGIGNNYLELSTEGGTLWRSLNPLADGETLGDAQSVGENGIYIDTMVQFTPTEDGAAPDTEAGDKLAIWLAKAENSEDCTLMVKCQQDTETNPGAKAFPLTNDGGNLSVQAGTWHRLTVKTIGGYSSEAGNRAAFEIYLDGEKLKSSGDHPFGSSSGLNEYVNAACLDSAIAGSLFPSLTTGDNGLKLQAVGLKGSGAIDDVVITPDTPAGLGGGAPAPEIEFTIETAAGVTAEWSKDGGTTWTEYDAETAKAAAGNILVRLTNGDGVTKTLAAFALTADNTTISADNETFGWAEYLGEAIAYGDGTAWGIDTKEELINFAKGCKTLGSANQTFVLTANITDLGAWDGVGTPAKEFNASEGMTQKEAMDAGLADAFKGTFDGRNYTISGLKFTIGATDASNTYRGFINMAYGATIKNLVVNGTGFDGTPTTAKYGCAMLVGNAFESTIENCTSKGTISSGTGNVAGLVVRIQDTTLKNCINEVNVTASGSKAGGITTFNQYDLEGSVIEGCVNKGSISSSASASVAGIISYHDNSKLTIRNCSNEGTLSSGGTVKANIIAQFSSNPKPTIEGTNSGKTAYLAVANSKCAGLNYATVADGVATYVADSALAAGGTYLVTTAGNTPAITLGANQTIAFDETLATITKTGITAAEGYDLETAVSGKVTTWSTEAKTIAVESVRLSETTLSLTVGDEAVTLTATVTPDTATDKTVTWETSDDNVVTVNGGVVTIVGAGEATITATAGGKSATCTVTVTAPAAEPQYPEYIGAEDESAKQKFDAWVKAKAGDGKFDRAGEVATPVWQDAYLLNVAPTEKDVEDAKAEFKITSITVNADGTVAIGEPSGDYNGTVEILGSAEVNGTYNAKTGEDWGENIRFFKAILK